MIFCYQKGDDQMELLQSVLVWILGTLGLAFITVLFSNGERIVKNASELFIICMYAHFSVLGSLISLDWKWFSANAIIASSTFFLIAGINHFSLLSMILPVSISLVIFILYILLANCGTAREERIVAGD